MTVGGAIQYTRIIELPGLELYTGRNVTRSVPRHVHELFCLTVAEAGVRVCETKRGRDYLTPGAIFVSSPGETHSGGAPRGLSYSCRSIRLDVRLLRLLLGRLDSGLPASTGFPVPLLTDRELYTAVRSFHDAAGQPSFLLETESRLLDIIFRLYSRHAATVPGISRLGGEPDPIRRVREYLQDRLDENVSVETLASIAALSPFHLCRVFEKEVGVPPHVYHLDLRLLKAARMLARGKKIADVAAETGFFDQSHFHKAFRRKFGVTPKRYSEN